jgi:RNA polymerase sigma-70 factor (ECF subfamily)
MDCAPASAFVSPPRTRALAAGRGLVYDEPAGTPGSNRSAAQVAGQPMREYDATNNESPADELLLIDVRRGSEPALRSLYERYADLVFTVALRIVGDRDLAQEVLQDVFFRCWERADTFSSERGQLRGWLIGIARNRAVDVLRSSQHQARLREQGSWALDGAREGNGEADTLDRLALRQAVRTALDALPTVQRQTIELAYYGGMTQSEIAQATATPLGTVKTRIRDGMHRLRSLLRPMVDPAEEAPEDVVDDLEQSHG